MSLPDELRAVIKGEVLDDAQTLETYSRDASLFVIKPEAVVYPKDAEDIKALVRFVNEKRAAGDDVSLTPRSGGTDMSGGPLSSSIVVGVTVHMNKLLELGDEYAVVEPGMFYRDFDKETLKRGLILPSYTASREICTVGGMVGNNSGGEKNLKYGKTARWVQELTMVLHDGEEHVFRPLKQDELEEKLHEQSLEGDIYRKIHALVTENAALISSKKPKVEKNSAGFALWDVIDRERGLFDITKILTGSQGTLGIFTRIKFGLVKPKAHSALVVMFMRDLSELGKIVNEVRTHDPESFESYDDHTFELGVKYFPEFAAQMKAGLVKLGIQFMPEMWMAMTGGVPKLVLLAEFTDETPEGALAKAQKCAADVDEKFDIKLRIAKNDAEAKKYWVIRRESFNLLRKKVHGLRTAPFIDDLVVPPHHLPEFLPKLEAILNEYDFTFTIAGHIGDGNFHIIPLMDTGKPDTARIIDELSHRVYSLVLEYEGSISGEHNDGLIRTPYLEQMFGQEMVGLFAEIQKIFDPNDIFNPGKKGSVTFDEAMTHLDTHVH
jgi:FAD/FMN-containing dehydrogenase